MVVHRRKYPWMHGQGCPGYTSRKRNSRGARESGDSALAPLPRASDRTASAGVLAEEAVQRWLHSFCVFLAPGALLLDTHVNCLPRTNWTPQLWYVLRSLLDPSRTQNMSSHLWPDPASTSAFPVQGHTPDLAASALLPKWH